MADKPNSVRAAQALAAFVSSVTAGASLSLSFLVIPRLLESPTPLMLLQWKHMFDKRKKTITYLGLAAAPAYAFLSAHFGGGTLRGSLLGRPGRAYAACAALCVGIVPYTVAVIMPTNRRIFALVDRHAAAASELVLRSDHAALLTTTTAQEEKSAKQLVDWWGVLNLGRAAMLLAASGIGIWVSLGA